MHTKNKRAFDKLVRFLDSYHIYAKEVGVGNDLLLSRVFSDFDTVGIVAEYMANSNAHPITALRELGLFDI